MTPRVLSIFVLSVSLLALTDSITAQPAVPELPEFRTIDGSGNNMMHSDWGAAEVAHRRLVPSAYVDGQGAPPDAGLPSARAISNAVAQQFENKANKRDASNYLWQWGQFIDHDFTLSLIADPVEPFAIPVPVGDPFFDPDGRGEETIALDRSRYTVVDGVRQQVNSITSYIDASMVYGSDLARANELRTLDGTGRLKTSAGDLLPFNVNGFPNAPTDHDPGFFLAGDLRANEVSTLTAMHTLFVREHNRLADWLRSRQPVLTGEETYQLARAIVGAQIQVITYGGYLPKLLGSNGLPPYVGYDPTVDATTVNAFAGAAYRVGHTQLSSSLHRIDAANREIPEGHLSLRDAFFDPSHVIDAGIEPLLRGLAAGVAQDVDGVVIDDVRNFLFGQPGRGGLDLVSLNIQRGRDHGLPRYNDARESLGLSRMASFEQISSNPGVAARLGSVYDHVNDIDLWVGALCEDHVDGGMVGELVGVILGYQFAAMRDGDRFYYAHVFDEEWIDWLESQTLADIIRRNTDIGFEIGDDVFSARSAAGIAQLEPVARPARLRLGYTYPNPTLGGVSMLVSSRDAFPEASVFDAAGRLVRTVGLTRDTSTEYRFDWDGTDRGGTRVAAGVYFIEVDASTGAATRKVVLVDP